MKTGNKLKHADFWAKNALGWFEETEGGELWRSAMGSAASLNQSYSGANEQNGKLQQSASTKTNSTTQLKRELKEKDDFLQRKDAELQHRQRIIEEKDVELAKLRKEIHELKCVVQQTTSKTSILSTIQEDSIKGGSFKPRKAMRSSRKEKRMAVSGESSSKAEEDTEKELERHPKDFRWVLLLLSVY